MENLVWVVALVIGYVFFTNRSDFEKATGFIFGLLFATGIALLLGGSNLVAQIGWVVVCQFAWTLFHGVHVGFKRFRNTLVVAVSITVVLSAAFLLKISSPPGFLAIAGILLVARWFVGLDIGKRGNAKSSDDDRSKTNSNVWHNLVVQLDRQVERNSRWAKLELWPRLRDRNNRRTFAVLFSCAFFLTTWHGTAGILVVPEGNIALVRGFSGQILDRTIEPGLRAVFPYFEQMILVPTAPFALPRGGSELVFSGQTIDGFKVTVQLEASVRLNSAVDKVVPFYQGQYRGDPTPAVRAALDRAFAEYLKSASVQNFLPVIGRSVDIELALLALAQSYLAVNQPAIKLEGVTIKKIWNEPALQVPIDALRGVGNAANQLREKITDSACQGNPNCP